MRLQDVAVGLRSPESDYFIWSSEYVRSSQIGGWSFRPMTMKHCLSPLGSASYVYRSSPVFTTTSSMTDTVSFAQSSKSKLPGGSVTPLLASRTRPTTTSQRGYTELLAYSTLPKFGIALLVQIRTIQAMTAYPRNPLSLWSTVERLPPV